jgi:hypothetical protein
VSGLESWHDIEIAVEAARIQEELQELIRLTRQFIEAKQRQILGQRDQEIKAWYQLLSGSADVCYDGIVPATDNLELKARTFAKGMMAAPNLSQSQLNCVGLAVYLATCTRNGSPFQFVLFDDPIQSMDDEHTESFKNQVIRKLLNQNFQIVILTHMQSVANSIEQLYRQDGAVYYRMEGYTQSGPAIVWKGPEIQKLLNDVRKNKDSVNDGFRKQAVQGLREFVERFVKDFFTAESGRPVSKKYENKSWGDLRSLLRQCAKFDSKDEPVLENTHNFTSQHLHADDTVPQSVPPGPHIHSHYISMQELLDKHSQLLGLK